MWFSKQPYLFTPWFNDVKCIKFLIFIYFIATHIRAKINDKKKNVYVQNQYYFDLQKNRVGQARTT